MTTNTRMSNFRRMVERLKLGQKLLTTQEKLTIMTRQQVYVNGHEGPESNNHYSAKICLVLKPGKKHVPH